MKYRSVSVRFVLLLFSLVLVMVSFAGLKYPAEAVSTDDIIKYWKPLQNPEPDAANATSYGHIYMTNSPTMENLRKSDNIPPEDQANLWYNSKTTIAQAAQAVAKIDPIPNPDLEKQGIYTFQAYFNAVGIAESIPWTSDPLFNIAWGNDWDLNAVAVSPISAWEDWGIGSSPIQGRIINYDLSTCRAQKWGYCQPEVLDWPGWKDPNNYPEEEDTERLRKPVLHTRDPLLGASSSGFTDFLTSNDGAEWLGAKWFKPHMQYMTEVQGVNNKPVYKNGTDIAKDIGGTFSIEYDNDGGGANARRSNKKARIIFQVKRKPGVPQTTKPLVGAVYKSWDKNKNWTGGDFIVEAKETKEYYELLKVTEVLQKNNYTDGKRIPEHNLNIDYASDPTTYSEYSVPAAASGQCGWETWYEKKYRYKTFIQPSGINNFRLVSLTDPKTNEKFELKAYRDQFGSTWFQGNYRGYLVKATYSKMADDDGVSNWRLEWIPDANTPNSVELTEISIDVPQNERRIAFNPNDKQAVHPIIMLKQKDNKPMPADYQVVVEVTKPDGSKQPYYAKTDSNGKLVALDGKPLATVTDTVGNYTIAVTKTVIDSNGKKQETPINTACVNIRKTYDHYEIYSSDRYIEVQKVDAQNLRLQGSRFTIYADKDGKADTAAGPVTTFLPPDGKAEANGNPNNGSWISRYPLKLGQKYWLVETQAPFAHELALPIPFTVTENKIVLGAVSKDQYTAIVSGNKATAITDTQRFPVGTKVEDSHVIKVEDVKAGKLPASGGSGILLYMVFGMVLIIAAFLIHQRTNSE